MTWLWGWALFTAGVAIGATIGGWCATRKFERLVDELRYPPARSEDPLGEIVTFRNRL